MSYAEDSKFTVWTNTGYYKSSQKADSSNLFVKKEFNRDNHTTVGFRSYLRERLGEAQDIGHVLVM